MVSLDKKLVTNSVRINSNLASKKSRMMIKWYLDLNCGHSRMLWGKPGDSKSPKRVRCLFCK